MSLTPLRRHISHITAVTHHPLMSPTYCLYLREHHTYEQRISPPPTAYGRTVSGYGNKIATEWLVRITGSAGTQPALDGGDCRWRRVYATCWSNAASLWVSVRGRRFYFYDCDLSH